jgi:hypothetical protein
MKGAQRGLPTKNLLTKSPVMKGLATRDTPMRGLTAKGPIEIGLVMENLTTTIAMMVV